MTRRTGYCCRGTFFSLLEVCFWCNFFVGWSRFRGVPQTIRLIRRLAQAFPLRKGAIHIFSERVNLLLRRLPFLFLARHQSCLIRGFLLYFYGKRLGIDICLHFGSQLDQGKFKTHCWILEQGIIRYEVEEVIRDYVVLVEYC